MYHLLVAYYFVGLIFNIICALDHLLNGDDVVNSIFVIPGLVLVGPFIWPFMWPLIRVFISEFREEFKFYGIGLFIKYLTKKSIHLRILKRRLRYLEGQGNFGGTILLTKWWNKLEGKPLFKDEAILSFKYFLSEKDYGFYVEDCHIYFISKIHLAHMLTSPDPDIREYFSKYKTLD